MLKKLQILLESLLNRGRILQNDEVAFHCAFCHHSKKKLQVNLRTQMWQCWVCGVKGRSLYHLFKKLKASATHFDKLQQFTGYVSNITTKKTYDNLSLPEEFKSFLDVDGSNPEFWNALSYLRKRGITREDILRYNIGFCETGPYSKMVIIPSYDKDGILNFFTGRSYYYDATFKHKNPKVSKDIIGFELYIDWSQPITVVEGVFDALAVKRNAIPLFGKIVLEKLKKAVVENNVKNINIALDKDARSKALQSCEYFINNGVAVTLINLDDGDPSDLGFSNVNTLIQGSNKLTSYKLMEMKIKEKMV
jgi:DNA primase|tara:strand:+ start:914 stop:1834 length:921 start_codon:yes stop_codon:yes gene_type:complete